MRQPDTTKSRSSPILCAQQGSLRAGLALCLATLVLFGCSRSRYREKADAEVYSLVGETASDPRWSLDDYTIEPSPESRFYDPFPPDCEPMPPDDPTAHRYMHCVDCKKGSPCWHACGDTPYVENPDWRAYLPVNDQGDVVLDLQGAVELSLIDSRDYQTRFEDIYLTALNVSLEEFRFDTQFFAGFSTFFESDGNGDLPATSELTVNGLAPANRLRMGKLFATGGELVVGIANSFVWQFSGPNSESSFTLVDLSFVQPLLRGAGRAVVMESLTVAQRQLLNEVRSLERFRREFYARVVTGRGGGSFGFYELLERQQQIRNQRSNVNSLRQSLAQLEALFTAGRVDILQVDQTRAQLLASESDLLGRLASYETAKDAFKFELGVPPDLPVRIEDTMLEQFELIDPLMQAMQNRIDTLLARVRETGQSLSEKDYTEFKKLAAELRVQRLPLIEMLASDYQKLQANLPSRREALERLASRGEVAAGDLSIRAISVETLNRRVAKIQEDLETGRPCLEQRWQELDRLVRREVSYFVDEKAGEIQPVQQWLIRLSSDWLELSLLQARIRLDTVVLRPLEISGQQAFVIAQENRRDLMNAQTDLVDVWRQIEVTANDLEAGLDVTFDGDISTTDDNPVRFRDKTGRMRVGFEFDAPLTRLAERNVYRAALINYQRARRDYMAFVDEINRSLRDTIRNMRLNELNFELARSGVIVSIAQVDFTQLRLVEPVKPDAPVGQLGSGGQTTARDLVDALSDLLNSQNGFLASWVDFQVLRVTLDLDLGTMQLDENSMWIDPGDDLGRSGGQFVGQSGGRSGINPSGDRTENQLPAELIELPPPVALPPQGEGAHAAPPVDGDAYRRNSRQMEFSPLEFSSLGTVQATYEENPGNARPVANWALPRVKRLSPGAQSGDWRPPERLPAADTP